MFRNNNQNQCTEQHANTHVDHIHMDLINIMHIITNIYYIHKNLKSAITTGNISTM